MPPDRLHLADALGHETSDKRLDILRRVGEAGSISEAARAAGVSYKAAWQAIETLSNLAGTALVERAVGGAGGGGARLTQAGVRLLEVAERLQAARTRLLQQLLGPASSQQPVPALLGAVGLRTSMRNQLPCRVMQIKRHSGAVRVLLELNDDQPLTSRITRESAELLDLRKGQTVMALCKATAMHVAASRGDDSLNHLCGEVSRAASAARGGESSLALPGGLQLVGMSEPGHGLKRGAQAWACFEESAVVIALPS